MKLYAIKLFFKEYRAEFSSPEILEDYRMCLFAKLFNLKLGKFCLALANTDKYRVMWKEFMMLCETNQNLTSDIFTNLNRDIPMIALIDPGMLDDILKFIKKVVPQEDQNNTNTEIISKILEALNNEMLAKPSERGSKSIFSVFNNPYTDAVKVKPEIKAKVTIKEKIQRYNAGYYKTPFLDSRKWLMSLKDVAEGGLENMNANDLKELINSGVLSVF